MRIPAIAALKISALAIIALAALLWFSPGTTDVEAGGGPGTNCATYADGVCEIAVGDVWFCSDAYSEGVCTTTIEPGDSVRWNFPGSKVFEHTTTACGDSCDDPVAEADARWNFDLPQEGVVTDLVPFDEAGVYLYYCQLHPLVHRGIIIVQAPVLTGDADCSGAVNAIDSAIILQFTAGLIDAAPCPQNADANYDEMSNAVDAALILQYVAGLIPVLPPV